MYPSETRKGPETRIVSSLPSGAMSIERGPVPGHGRSAWVKFNGMVWTNGHPAGKAPGDDAAAAPGAFSIRSAAASSTRNSWPVSRSLMRNTFSISNDFSVADAPSVVGETGVWG